MTKMLQSSTIIQKLVSGQKQSVTLQGELAKQDISKMVPEETITGTANLINNMKILGMQLAEDIGPALNSVMGFFAGIASFLAENNAVLPVFIGMMGLMALKSIYTAGTKRLEIQATQELTSATLAQTASQEALNAAKDRGNAKTGATVAAAAVETGANKAVTGSNLARAGSNAAVGATKGSLALPFPFNILAAVTAAGTLITMIASIMATSKGLQVGTGIGGVKKDTVEALHAGETVLNAEDTEMLRKQQAAIGGMRGTAASVDNKKLEENQQIANKTLEKMYTVLDDALGGARPRLATSLANATTDTLTV